MEKYHYNTPNGVYTVTLQRTNRRMNTGQICVKYQLIAPDGEVIFSGDDLGASPLHLPESEETAISLLGFLTCKPGDVEEEYFDKYTPSQMAWAQGDDCEWLSSIVYDYETQE